MSDQNINKVLKKCCKEMIEFSSKMAGVGFTIGEEDEIQGLISVGPNTEYVYFSDGYSKYPSLILKYCPFCGKLIN